MIRIVLIHWNAAEAAPHLLHLHRLGCDVQHFSRYDSTAGRAWRASPPDAFLIDLSRLPSHGREIAIALRSGPKTRAVPLIFLDGAAEKVSAVREVLPDAVFSRWEQVDEAISTAMIPVSEPVQPVPMMQRYAGRTTAQKLGIVAQSTVILVDPPRDVETVLGSLPEQVDLTEEPMRPGEVTLWFVREPATLYEGIAAHARLAAHSKLWILWPKKRSRGQQGGLSEQMLREAALSLDLIDYKVCSVNEIWSGLCFARRGRPAAV